MPLLDHSGGYPKHHTKENHARTLRVTEEQTSDVSVPDSLLAWLYQVCFELCYNLVHILFAERNHCLVVKNNISQKSVRLFIGVSLLDRVYTLSALVTPLETHHSNHAQQKNW